MQCKTPSSRFADYLGYVWGVDYLHTNRINRLALFLPIDKFLVRSYLNYMLATTETRRSTKTTLEVVWTDALEANRQALQAPKAVSASIWVAGARTPRTDTQLIPLYPF